MTATCGVLPILQQVSDFIVMKVSVCIPTYNQALYLPKAVDSALEQTTDEVFEVIVCDDASTDDTAKVMEAYRENPRVRYFRQPANLGISGNSRFALMEAKGELVIRLDSDDFLMPGYAETLSREFERHPTMGVGHVKVNEVDENDVIRRLRSLRRPTGFQSGEEAFRAAHQGYKVSANICIFRRSALEDVGFFTEGMDYAEDWDMWTRIADAGWGNFYVDEVLANYRVWTDAGGYREGRKITELTGIINIFGGTIEPAYVRRGWKTDILERRKKAIACDHVRALANMPGDSADYRKVMGLLEELGSSPSLSMRISLVKLGLGNLLNVKADLEIALRDRVKKFLSKNQEDKFCC